MKEIETKVLEVDKEKIRQALKALGAKEVQNTRLVVDWYCPKLVRYAFLRKNNLK